MVKFVKWVSGDLERWVGMREGLVSGSDTGKMSGAACGDSHFFLRKGGQEARTVGYEG